MSTRRSAPQPAVDVKAETEEVAAEEAERKKQKRRMIGVDPSLIISEQRSKRRRSPTPEAEIEVDTKSAVPNPKDGVRAKQYGMQIMKKIMDAMDSEYAFPKSHC